MKKIINIFITIVIFLFIFNIDVKGENVDFACTYTNGTNKIKINIRGNRASEATFGATSTLFNNKNEYILIPANFITPSGTNYHTTIYGGYGEGNNAEALYGCSKEIYLATKDGSVVYLDVVDTSNFSGTAQGVNGQGSFKIPVIFFSESAFKILNNSLTDTEIELDEAMENTILKNDYNLTTFTLKKDSSGSVKIEKPTETNDKIQYCYYKSSCGKVIQLKFTIGNVNMAVFNNGNGLYDWNNTQICPTSIVESNNLYTGKESSCGTGSTNCYTFISQSSNENKSLIQEGDCSVQSYDTNNGGVILTKYIFYGSNIDSKNIHLYNKNGSIEAMINSVTIEISNMNLYSQLFVNQDVQKYPKYIIKAKGSNEYVFIDSIKNDDGKIIESDELYISQTVFATSGTGLSNEMAIETCKQLFGNDFLEFLNDYVFKIIWIGVPILLILLTSFDFAKVVFVDDKEGIQNAFNRLWKRAIAAILIFLTPYIIILIANIIDPTQTTIQSCAKKIREMGSTSYIVK